MEVEVGGKGGGGGGTVEVMTILLEEIMQLLRLYLTFLFKKKSIRRENGGYGWHAKSIRQWWMVTSS